MRPSITQAISDFVEAASRVDWGHQYEREDDGEELRKAAEHLEKVLKDHIETVVAQKFAQLSDKSRQETRIIARLKRAIRPPRSI